MSWSYRHRHGNPNRRAHLSRRKKKNKGTYLRLWREKMAKAAAEGASTSQTTQDNSDGQETKVNAEKSSSSKQNNKNTNQLPIGNKEVTESAEMETNIGAPTSLLNSSDILIKQEIIETESEYSIFDDVLFAKGPPEVQFERQRLNSHPESSNSNTDILSCKQTHVVATAHAPSHSLRTVKVESDVTSNSCGVISKRNSALSIVPSTLNYTSFESSKKDESIQSKVSHHVVNVTDSESSSNNAQVELGVSSHIVSQSLPQDLNCNNASTQTEIPSRSSRSRRKDKFEVFGELIATKLRNLNSESSAFVQSAITFIISEAEMGILLNIDGKSNSDTRTDNIRKNTDESENTHRSTEKENIQPRRSPRVKIPNVVIVNCDTSSRNETNHHRVDSHTENPSVVTTTDSENSLRNEPIQPTVASPIQNLLPSAVPESTSNSANQTVVSSHTICASVPPVLYITNPSSNAPIQPSFPFPMRARDEFDSYGEFVASKLRNLDPRTCAFVQTAFADFILKAEMGRFGNEQSFSANKTNDTVRNMPSNNLNSLNQNNVNSHIIVPNLPSYVVQTGFNLAPLNFCTVQAPMEIIPNVHSVLK